MNRHPLPLVGLFLATMLAGCTQAEPADIAVASYPAAFLAETLVGDDLIVVDLGAGAGLHDFEPSARDLAQLRQTTHLVLWSENLESWAHRAESSLGRNAPDVIELLHLPTGEHAIEGKDDPGHDHGHDHGAADPHTWTDPLAMAASAEHLAQELSTAYPELAANITARADALTEELETLHAAYAEALAECRIDVAITNHEAHAYLARRYGFDLLTLHGLTPGSEPSPATLEHIIETIEEHGVETIFIEEGTDAGALASIKQETGVAVDVLHTLENRPASGDYLSVQMQNIQKLAQALDCL